MPPDPPTTTRFARFPKSHQYIHPSYATYCLRQEALQHALHTQHYLPHCLPQPSVCTQLTNTKHIYSWQNGTRCRDVKLLWCHSHLVWLVFEGSIPTCACFHSENFFVTLYIRLTVLLCRSLCMQCIAQGDCTSFCSMHTTFDDNWCKNSGWNWRNQKSCTYMHQQSSLIHEQSMNHISLKKGKLDVTQSHALHRICYAKSPTVPANTRPHQLCWDDREMGISYDKASQVAGFIHIWTRTYMTGALGSIPGNCWLFTSFSFKPPKAKMSYFKDSLSTYIHLSADMEYAHFIFEMFAQDLPIGMNYILKERKMCIRREPPNAGINYLKYINSPWLGQLKPGS